MTREADTRSAPSSAPPSPSRRTLFAGAGAVGALAAAAAALPGTRVEATASASAGTAEAGNGYRLTEHVKRYYQTARV
jgi:hypothetical protein